MKCFFYRAKVVAKEYKTDEFIGCMRSLLPEFRKEKECLAYNLYQDIEKENTYSVVAEWQTRQAMEKHFQTLNFEVFIGAARVLGETFEFNIAEVLKTGGFELVDQITSQQKQSAAGD